MPHGVNSVGVCNGSVWFLSGWIPRSLGNLVSHRVGGIEAPLGTWGNLNRSSGCPCRGDHLRGDGIPAGVIGSLLALLGG